jgi:hypothetical protein
LVVAGMAWNYTRYRLSRSYALAALSVLMVLLILLLPFNVAYRALSSSDSQRGYISDIGRIADAFNQVADSRFADVLDESADYFLQRFSNISIVGIILDSQLSGMETSIAESSYARAVYSFVPRFIWPDKPAVAIGREVTVRLGLGPVDAVVLGAEVSNTSVGLTMVGEAIYNLPSFAAPVIMILIGIAFRWGYESTLLLFRHKVSVAGALAGFLWFYIVFALNEGNLASVFAGAVKYLVFLWLLLKLLGYRKRVEVDNAARARRA